LSDEVMKRMLNLTAMAWFRACLLALPLAVCVQAQEASPQPVNRSASPQSTTREVSELEKGNLARVAAASVQIQVVLLKEPGILVELKRWMAKEATENGQLVDDNLLTDQAIFDRLDTDVVFRSVATRLVQKYGYLLPSVNPDSPVAKEEDLILKERARHLVNVEAQEDAEAMHPPDAQQKQGQEAERKLREANCGPLREQGCENPKSEYQFDHGDGPQDFQDNEGPSSPTNPQNGNPMLPPQAQPEVQTMHARSRMQDSDQLSNGGLGATLGMGADVGMRAQGALETVMRTGGDSDASGLPVSLDKGDMSALSSSLTGRIDNPYSSDRDINKPIRLVRNGHSRPYSSQEMPPVAMVRRPNPFADVPSLYDLYVQAGSSVRTPERFGLDVFRNGTRDIDAIPMDLPVGPDYIVGPGDGLTINLWGGISGRMTRVVDRQGRINLPEAGPLLVSGRPLGEVQQAVEEALRTQYRDASADVTLARLRTVRVYVVGEVAQPGAYDISALSSPISALVEAGGITPRGSLRKLKHFRGKQLIEEIDAYDLLLHGVNPEAKRLENGDSILVPSLGPEVTVTGMVRRPAIYELKGENSLEDVVELAGGVLPAATLKHIEVQRLIEHEKRTMLSIDLQAEENPDAVVKQLGEFKIQADDLVHIFPIAPYNETAIYLQGHVLRPGKYSYRDGMKLTDLIASYKDLLPEPSGKYAEIIRLNPPDFRPSVESFDLAAAMTSPGDAPKLQPLDTVRIFSRYDFESAPAVSVDGDVRKPGMYQLSGQARLRDAVYLAGGVSSDASLESAQIFRTESDGKMTIASVNLGDALSGNSNANIILAPRDRLLIHKNLAIADPPTVSIKGEVGKPGKYPLTSNMHIRDLILTAGGLKRSADAQTADLTRYAEGDAPVVQTESQTVQLEDVMSGDVKENMLLKDGDVLTVRQSPGWNDIGANVVVRGEVNHPGSYGIRPGERLSSVLERAGGFSQYAYPYGAVLMRKEVRELEEKSRMELIQRVKVEQVHLKALPENDEDQRNAKLTAIGQSEVSLTALQSNPPVGRVVIHIQSDLHAWKNTESDVVLRDGDVLVIPKKSNVVMITGQVFNPTAVSCRSGQSANWYLSQAGGLTGIADKKAIFVVRADGSVIAAKNNGGGWWQGDPLDAALKPGDTIVVPEKAPKVGSRNWPLVFQSAQLAASVALAVAYIHP
jgi:polysaccharide biosynthesis/export protein